MKHYMNPSYGAHMGDNAEEEGEHASGEAESASHLPNIFIHSHAKGHTVHVHHPEGHHTKHEHALGDIEGIARHIHKHMGGGEGKSVMEAEHEQPGAGE